MPLPPPYDIPAAVREAAAILIHNPNRRDEVSRFVLRAGKELAYVIRANHARTDAVAKTYGEALILGAGSIGGFANCETSMTMVNIQTVAGYYLWTGEEIELPPDSAFR